MPVTSITTDPQALTMTVVADFSVPVERLWEAYADPRQIEKFWGPVEWPATFTRHDMTPGGRSEYVMTGPNGERSAGVWEYESVDPGKSFVVLDGFAKEDGTLNEDMPRMRVTFTFESTPTGSRLTDVAEFESLEALETVIEMGIVEGTRSAMSQIDTVLADLASFAAGRGTEVQILSDTTIRVSRVIRGTAEQVWRAHHDPELMRLWLLGPDGWTMPVCEVATTVGDTYRYVWEPEGGGEGGFGFEGELLESVENVRAVTTERMIGMDYPGTVNEMTLTPRRDGTLIAIVITYANAEQRDIVLGTGMTDGMETSYARLEGILADA